MPDDPALMPIGFLTLEIPVAASGGVQSGGLPLRIVINPDCPDRIEVPLPGWIWRGVAPDAPAWILWQGGAFALTRADVRDRLRDLVALPVQDCDAPALVGALEHVHHGGLGASAPDAATLDWLRKAGWATGLTALFDAPFAPPATPPGQVAIAAFGKALHQRGPESDLDAGLDVALNAGLDAGLALPPQPEDIAALILAVTVEYCRADRMPALLAGLKRHAVPDPFDDPVAPWTRAQALAFALARGQVERARDLIDRIAAQPQDWVATPALAWALRHPFTPAGRHLPAALRNAVVDGATRFAQSRAPLACVQMIDATLDLIDAGLALLPADLSEAVVWRVLGAFGTSPRFWAGIAALADGGRPVPAELLAGQRAFALLVQGLERADLSHCATALRRLRNLGVADIDRIRAEVLISADPGAAEMDSAVGSALDQALGDGPNGAMQALRLALAPRGVGDRSVPEWLLTKALRWADRDIPTAPLADVQRRAMGMARALAAPDAPDAAAVWPADTAQAQVAALIPVLAQLAGPEAGHSGLALACALAADLVGDGTERAQAALRHLLPQVLALLQDQPAPPGLMDLPFPRSAAARLRACLSDAAPEFAPDLAALCAALPPLPPQAPALSLRRPQGLALGPALIDTLVVVVSCHALLDSRVAALRRGWLADLARMGVPHVILVGGDQTRLSGDILQVAAPDSYEGLPEKILAMIDWVHAETGFAHVLKIDDDCHLDPVAWFGDALWRQAEWYGRRLDKSGALADRDWHQSRARDPVSRISLDTLPLRGVYTDGSTGYSLGRAAMAAVVAAAGGVHGRRLIAGAFSEDRLIGAILDPAGFTPDSRNYHSLILRRTHPQGPAVPQWAEGVMPTPHMRHTKVVHFDGIVPDDPRSDRPAPPRLWPANRLPGTGYDNGSLCLIGSSDQVAEARLAAARQAPVAVVSVVRNERQILPHFLAHYRALGVTGFLIADNLSQDGTLAYLADQPDVALFSAASQFRTTDQGTDWKLALMGQLRMGRWSLVADADEFLLLPRGVSLPDHMAALPAGVDAQRVLMQDMYPPGPFAQADFATAPPFQAAPLFDAQPFLRHSIWRGPFSDTQTLTSALRHRLMPGARVDAFVAQKTAFVRYRPWMRFSTSLHYAAEVALAPDDLTFAHFKYSARFATKAATEARRGQYWNGAEEYRTYGTTGFAEVPDGRVAREGGL